MVTMGMEIAMARGRFLTRLKFIQSGFITEKVKSTASAVQERNRFIKDKLPFWIFDLLRDKIERVPARVRKKCRVECQGDVAGIGARSLEGRLKVVSITCRKKCNIKFKIVVPFNPGMKVYKDIVGLWLRKQTGL